MEDTYWEEDMESRELQKLGSTLLKVTAGLLVSVYPNVSQATNQQVPHK